MALSQSHGEKCPETGWEQCANTGLAAAALLSQPRPHQWESTVCSPVSALQTPPSAHPPSILVKKSHCFLQNCLVESVFLPGMKRSDLKIKLQVCACVLMCTCAPVCVCACLPMRACAHTCICANSWQILLPEVLCLTKQSKVSFPESVPRWGTVCWKNSVGFFKCSESGHTRKRAGQAPGHQQQPLPQHGRPHASETPVLSVRLASSSTGCGEV